MLCAPARGCQKRRGPDARELCAVDRFLPFLLVIGALGLSVGCMGSSRGGGGGDDDASRRAEETARWLRTTQLSEDGSPEFVSHSLLHVTAGSTCSAHQNYVDSYWDAYGELSTAESELEWSDDYYRQLCLLQREFYETMVGAMGSGGEPGVETVTFLLDHPDAVEDGLSMPDSYQLEEDSAGDDDDGPSTSQVLPIFSGLFRRQVGDNEFQVWLDGADCDAVESSLDLEAIPSVGGYEEGTVVEGLLDVTEAGDSARTVVLADAELELYDEESSWQQSFSLDATFQLCEVTYPDSLGAMR